MNRIVLCMKWGTLFGADYVNVLHAAVRAHMTGRYRFICLTDDSRGFADGIEALPLPDVGLSAAEWYTPGVWPKLGLFLANLHGLEGRALFVDLDMMILDALDPFFEVPGGVVVQDMGQGWRRRPRPGPREAGTCIFAYDIGGQPQIADSFIANKTDVIQRFINEQDYVGQMARDLAFWPDGWVVSFKRHVARRGGIDLLVPPAAPADARVIAFHGAPRPADLLRRGIWGDFPHMGRGPIGWMCDYWTRFGGFFADR
ncbi:MAG: hypothetical protein HC844_19340 [Tabrizicola sp.]|nr:hypothetical protein [Tabrizicola sp.]